MPVECVLDDERDDCAHDADDAELADLVDQRPKPGVKTANQAQLAQFLSLPRDDDAAFRPPT
jgi:hypothetical protein